MMFAAETVALTLIGSAARSRYMRERLMHMLAEQVDKHYRLVEPALAPVAGAVLLALEHHGIALDEPLLRTLAAHPQAAFRAEEAA